MGQGWGGVQLRAAFSPSTLGLEACGTKHMGPRVQETTLAFSGNMSGGDSAYGIGPVFGVE